MKARQLELCYLFVGDRRGSEYVGGIMEFDEGQLGIVPRGGWRMWVLVQDGVTFVGGPGGYNTSSSIPL